MVRVDDLYIRNSYTCILSLKWVAIKMNYKILHVIILLIAVVLGNACIENAEPQTGQEKLIVVVSILPQADFVEQVGGDKVEVIVMIAPGASPATYEPTASQLKAISSATM